AKVKSVIYLFMAGGPSQLELFDYKPKLQDLNGKPIPDSYLKNKRFAFMDSFTKQVPQLLGSRRTFTRHGTAGSYVSECLPHTAGIVDDIAIVRSVATDVFNHAPANVFMNTGSPQFGRPSMGAWVTYGIGSESQNLPGFIVLQSGPRGPRGGAACWSSGFLPTTYQGVPFRTSGEPILNLTSPKGVSPQRQREVLDAVRDLNAERLADTGDPEIATRIASYEMAFRMQTSAPELIDLAGEVRDVGGKDVGRNHHIDAFTVWLAGGGVKPGLNLGATDEFGYAPVEDKVHVHDLQATILHLLGLEHTRLTFRFQGRDFRLTDVHGSVVQEILA